MAVTWDTPPTAEELSAIDPWSTPPTPEEMGDDPWSAPPTPEEISAAAPKPTPDTSFSGALRQGIDQPLEALGTTAEVLGMPKVASILRGATDAPENYESAGERFIKPQAGDTTVLGFAPAQIPRAVVEQIGQVGGSILSRIVGAATGGAIGGAIGGAAGTPTGPGALVTGTTGTAAGAITGAFVGPFLFEALQIVGPVAKERAKNNGRAEPDGSDIAAALSTAAAGGALNAIGARYLPGGNKAVGSAVSKISKAFVSEGITEGSQSLAQQTGETLGTEKGLDVSARQAIGEALIGAGAGGTIAAVASPVTANETIDKVLEETESATPPAPVSLEIIEQENAAVASGEAQPIVSSPEPVEAGTSNLSAEVQKNIDDAKMINPENPEQFLQGMADAAREQGKEEAALNFEAAVQEISSPSVEPDSGPPQAVTTETPAGTTGPEPVTPEPTGARGRKSPELLAALEGRLTDDGPKLKPIERSEAGGIFTGGRKPTAVKAVGLPPSGSKNWLRIPGAFSRLFKGLERKGARLVLEDTKNPIGKLLGKQTRLHVDTEQELFGKAQSHLDRALKGLSRNTADNAFSEIEGYLRAKENGRPLPGISSVSQRILKAWQDIAKETGDIARSEGVQVFDAKKGGYRPMGNLGADYVPRMFRNEVEKVLRDPQSDPVLFNNLAQSIATHRGVTLDAAAAELRGVAGRFQSNDFLGNLELARSEQMPEIFYDYDLRNLASRYIPRYSERMGQIIAFGQRLGTREAPVQKNLWDVARSESEDSYTQQWLNAAEDQATNFQQGNPTVATAKRLQTLGSASLLSDPTTTVLRNMASGLSSTTELFGARRSLKAVLDTVRSGQSKMMARDIGAVRDNMAEYLHADQLGQTFVDDAIRAVTDKALKWSGFTGSENFVRTHNGLVASQFAKDVVTAISKNPASKLSKEGLAMFKRWDVDAKKVVSEKADWKTGEETRKFIRTAIREMQGGYRYDQVPLWANSSAGRFFYQYGRWGVQRSQNLYNNIIRPLIGEEVEWNGKKMTNRNIAPALRAAVALGILGETFAGFAKLLFDRDRKDASLNEIAQAFGEDEKYALALAGERLVNDFVMAGSLGIWGQPVDFVKNFKDQSRLKNPAEPPSLASLKAVSEILLTWKDTGSLTVRDWMKFASQVLRGPVNVSNVARNVFDEPLYEAENDVKTLRAAAIRWADRSKMDIASRSRGQFRKGKLANVYEPIYEALLVGDVDRAKLMTSEFLSSQPDVSTARKNLRASVVARQPFRAGPYNSAGHRTDFLNWARKNLSKQDIQQVERVNARYLESAKRAGLMN